MILSRAHRVSLRLIPRVSTTFQSYRAVSFERPKFKKVQKGAIRRIKRFRDNDWIGAQDALVDIKSLKDWSQVQQTLAVRSSDGTYCKESDYKKAVNEGFGVLREKIATNKFKYKQYDDTLLHRRAFTISFELFRDELSKKLETYVNGTQSPLRLEQILNPSLNTLPDLLHGSINGKVPLLQKLAEKKNLRSVRDQIDYYFEHAFHKVMSRQLAADLPPQAHNVDIANPEEWYPDARKIRRKLILHMGPTNSGKTYHALKRLKEANDGYYAGPLRLLAREIYERFKAEGIRCNLVTGEEVISDLDEFGISAPLSSGTVEMISTTRKYEVAVLDEIQMLGDKDRGWAWTHALLGVQAKEVHLCGEESVIPLITKIAKSTGDEVIINRYNRLGKLEVEDQVVNKGFNGLQKGDCIVAFSKKRIWAYKDQIQTKTGLKCGVIYGALPGETRAAEADKFNSGEYDVLVASDAVGMGLNLSINRVIFDTHNKFNGEALEELETPFVKQIGGRAGRFRVAPTASTKGTTQTSQDGKKASVGYVSAFFPDTLEYVKEHMSRPTIFLEKAYVWPSDEIWTLYSSTFPAGTSFVTVLETFGNECADSSLYTIASIKSRLAIGEAIKNVKNMLVSDQLRIGTAPLGTQLPLFGKVISEFSKNVVMGFTKSILDFEFLDFRCLNQPAYEDRLGEYEELHKYVLLFLWLHNRYPTFFVNTEGAIEIKESLEAKIEKVLKSKKQPRIGRYDKSDRRNAHSRSGPANYSFNDTGSFNQDKPYQRRNQYESKPYKKRGAYSSHKPEPFLGAQDSYSAKRRESFDTWLNYSSNKGSSDSR